MEYARRIDFTGLASYAFDTKGNIVDARQFPKPAGSSENPATGIAAAALAFALSQQNYRLSDPKQTIHKRQKWGVGAPLETQVQSRGRSGNINGRWITGNVEYSEK
jgi:trans-2,3-dihydro-3-hydroxyanthranilate isomerase